VVICVIVKKYRKFTENNASGVVCGKNPAGPLLMKGRIKKIGREDSFKAHFIIIQTCISSLLRVP
jgi:hypothetical protein